MIYSYEHRNLNSKYGTDKEKKDNFRGTIKINIFRDRGQHRN